MTSTPFIAALAAGSLLAASAAPAPTAAPIRYKAVIASKQVVDLSVLGQENQVVEQTATSYFQLSVSDSAGSRVLHLVIDSLAPDAKIAAQIPAPILDSARGAVYHLVLDAKGALDMKAIKAGGPLAKAFAGSITEFLPRISGALTAGREWTDTLETTREIPSGALKSKTVTNYAVAGTEMVDGKTAVKLNAAFAASQTGAQETPGGTADLAGTSSGTASWLLAGDQSIVSLNRKEEVSLTVTLAAAPAPIPIKQTQDATITRLP